MTLPTSHPALEQKHVENAKFFGTRQDLVASLDQLKGGKVIAEVGVAHGEFSDFMIKTLQPREFVAFDLFNISRPDQLWGIDTDKLFGGRTHLEFYKSRFADINLKTEKGDSAITIAKYPDAYFDMMYIDGDHTYEGVKADAMLALKKTKPDGIIIFNDYTLFGGYGIVQVVNEIVVGQGYEVIGFALQHQMFCDIAIRKKQ